MIEQTPNPIKYRKHLIQFEPDILKSEPFAPYGNVIYDRAAPPGIDNNFTIIAQRHNGHAGWPSGALESQVAIFRILVKLHEAEKIDMIADENIAFGAQPSESRKDRFRNFLNAHNSRDFSDEGLKELFIASSENAAMLAHTLLDIPLSGLENFFAYNSQIEIQSKARASLSEPKESIEFTSSEFHLSINYYSKIRAASILQNAARVFNETSDKNIACIMGRLHAVDFIDIQTQGKLLLPSIPYLGTKEILPSVTMDSPNDYATTIIMPEVLMGSVNLFIYET